MGSHDEEQQRRGEPPVDAHGIGGAGWIGSSRHEAMRWPGAGSERLSKSLWRRTADSLAAAVGGAVTAVVVFLFS